MFPYVEIPLDTCLISDKLPVDKVPALDTYLLVAWTSPGTESFIRIYRKIAIYNHNQAQLENELASDIEKLDFNDDAQPEDNEFVKKLEKLRSMGFTDEQLIYTTLKKYEGDLDKAVANLVSLIN